MSNDGTTCILWHSPDKSIYLVDIPRSIELASGIWRDTGKHLLSCQAISTPFASNEPKTAAARSRLEKQTRDDRLLYVGIVKSALDVLAAGHVGQWCLPRHFKTAASPRLAKRKLSNVGDDDTKGNRDILTEDGTALMSSLCHEESRTTKMRFELSSRENDWECDDAPDKSDSWQGVAHNDTDTTLSLQVSAQDGTQRTRFWLPAHSSFFLSDCASSHEFRTRVRDRAHLNDTPRTFDLIVMDPPWPNASVRRGHRKGSGHYNVSDSMWTLRDLLYGMDVDVLLARHGLLCIWITNKPTVRELLLGDNELLDTWNLELVEEWIWIKTTTDGRPVLPVDGMWRKPYELLLVCRKRIGSDDKGQTPPIRRRVIAAVPDLHSRKPCVKELVQDVFGLAPGYRGLEIFARHLVEGWWSWGNEALKFNHAMCWVP